MGAAQFQRGNREWFVDRRAPDRTLQVTWHDNDGTAVLSMWQGEVCTATFQLRLEDAAALIQHLADGLDRFAAEAAAPADILPFPPR